MKRLFLATTMALCAISSTQAADDSSLVHNGTANNKSRNGGYFEFGVSLNWLGTSEGLTVGNETLISGAYRYRRMFFEALNPASGLTNGSVGGLNLGVNVFRNNRWAIDLIAASPQWGLSQRASKIDFKNPVESEAERDLLNRRNFYNGAGVRVTGYFGDAILQYRLVTDYHGGNGVIGTARVGYSKPVRNWNYHGFVGVDHISQESGQYWYGVSDEEATSRFPAYNVDESTINYSAEIGVTIPLREHVVFRSTARASHFANTIAKSPLQEGDSQINWNSSISYVF